MRTFLLFASLCAAIFQPLAADPVINEFCASNHNGLQDENGDRPDWVEIFNPDNTAANLTNWYLTDSASNTFAAGETLYESCDWFTWSNANGTTGTTAILLNWQITNHTDDYNDPRNSMDWYTCFGFRSKHAGVVNFLFMDGRVAGLLPALAELDVEALVRERVLVEHGHGMARPQSGRGHG